MNIMKLYSTVSKLRYNHPLMYSLLRVLYEWNNNIKSLQHYIFRVFPLQNNKILLCNYSGKEYGDNPKYIAEYILNKKLDYKLFWIIHKENMQHAEFPKDIVTVKYGSLRALYHQTTAKVWIDNVRKLGDTRKRTGQIYIQTWHGFGPKKIVDGKNAISHSQIRTFQRDSKITDLYISLSHRQTEIYRDEFWYNGDVLESGYPRNDIFFSDRYSDIHEKVCCILNIPPAKKIILYAPTFKQDFKLTTYNLSYYKLVSSLEKHFGGEWIILVRLHHLVSERSTELEYDNKHVIDASNYLDMQELLLISDILITDYSSCMFDFMATKRPCFLYHPDVKEYDDTRGFSIQPEELPFPRAHSNEELMQIIEKFDLDTYLENLEKGHEYFGMQDNGTASKAVVDWIENKINNP